MRVLNLGKSKESYKKGINPYSKRKIAPAHLQGTLKITEPFRRQTKSVPSLNSDSQFDVCVKREKDTYTGKNMLGIGTLHKSNPIPIFDPDHAVDLATMRRS
jgi:hypothetical protein|tara:strand:+ start:11054 stop:11359 length:306 start_codon:yes stop_codon:yes gene_type:complete